MPSTPPSTAPRPKTGRDGATAPFTEALLKRLASPALDVRHLFGYVRDDVMAATSRVQQPHIYGTLGGPPLYLQQ